ncbi:MAG: hypothetical protein O9264_06420 [Leptospira sp.]|nr:hypothetical protein [Leptospira sp.]
MKILKLTLLLFFTFPIFGWEKAIDKNGVKDCKVYFVMTVPFPLNNRDTVNKFELSEDSLGNIKIKIYALPNDVAEKK